jgi:uncharacterized protein (TIGR02996 family)
MHERFLQAIRDDPAAEPSWLNYTDCLEEQSDPRGEVLRILCVVGLPSNLEYYPNLLERMQALRHQVDEEWLKEIFELREKMARAVSDTGRPGPAEIDAMWQDISIAPSPITAREQQQAVQDFQQVLRFKCNVGARAIFHRFLLSPHPVLTWYGSRNRWADVHFFPRFVRSPAVRSALPVLAKAPRRGAPGRRRIVGGGDFDTDIDEQECQYSSGAGLIEQLISTVSEIGEAGSGFRVSADMPSVVGRFGAALFGNRLAELQICYATVAWAPWFLNDGMWDLTWLIIDRREWLVSLLCLSASD